MCQSVDRVERFARSDATWAQCDVRTKSTFTVGICYCEAVKVASQAISGGYPGVE